MAVAAGRPPNISNNSLISIVCKYFNFLNVHEGYIKTLPSYSDINYYFQGESSDGEGYQFILKLFNPLYSSLPELKGINQLMRLIQSCKIIPQCPQKSRAGPDVIKLYHWELLMHHSTFTDDESVTSLQEKMREASCPGSCIATDDLFCYMSIFSFAYGEMFDFVEKKYITPELLYQIGTMLAKMDKELIDKFTNEAIESRENRSWNLLHFLDMRKKLHLIDNSLRAEKILNAFEKYVTPKLPNFRRSVIHADANGLNIVLKNLLSDKGKGYCYSSFIDFGNSCKTCTVFELGICLAYVMMENLKTVNCSNVLEFVHPLIKGYNSVLPLSEEEQDCLYYLVLARCCQSAINGEIGFKKEPWNKYLLTTVRKCWLLVDELLDMSKEDVDKVWFSKET